jgi:hypothetical protein
MLTGKKLGGAHRGVPWRSHEVSRIEALSDAVFAFAVTLLVVALEVPQTFDELWSKMHGFIAFAISFALLFQVWYAQQTFFRRYGLQDVFTIVLNGTLLFLVLFYTYPLKFLFSFLVNEWTGGGGMAHLPDGRQVPMLADLHQGRIMMIIYDVGFGAVFTVFVLLYHHAWRKRDELALTEVERFDARVSIESNGIMVGVALLSLVVLFATDSPGFAGLTYFLTGVAHSIHGTMRGRERRRLHEGATAV